MDSLQHLNGKRFCSDKVFISRFLRAHVQAVIDVFTHPGKSLEASTSREEDNERQTCFKDKDKDKDMVRRRVWVPSPLLTTGQTCFRGSHRLTTHDIVIVCRIWSNITEDNVCQCKQQSNRICIIISRPDRRADVLPSYHS